ncbi:protein LATERAL ROOT PRIMORDIUM 1 [Corylus avellana]|uniref:protein LATERAL ROOT PRIMORDIUM 1 n=1 Tax=Corylus avellana TaxID=13451 RepID=UPI00286AD200|nr:protein LATERAL ROOT PRIMORDIUM 1 [Corylus avellana]
MWSATPSRPVNYGLAPTDMGMVGLRDLFVVAPASSFNHHHHHHHHQHDPIISDPHSINASNPATALGVGVGVGVFPLLTAAPCLASASNVGVEDDNNMLSSRSRSGGGGIHLWQNSNQPTAQHGHYFKKPAILDHGGSGNNLVQSGGVGGGIGGSPTTTSSTGTATCQDCGNQAKKDCSHRRCRTCCKSRGFDCATHVKSTWVPAARRRERQLMGASGSAAAGSSGATSGAKKPRLIGSQTTTTSHTSTSNTTPPRSFDTSSSHQDASFKEGLPGQVRAPAVFKCVRVTAVEDGEDEYAYQAVVKIGGHVFKGFLYDQGLENREGYPNISELHLGGGSGGGGGVAGRNGASSSSPILDPTDVYAGGALLGGSSYGNPIN